MLRGSLVAIVACASAAFACSPPPTAVVAKSSCRAGTRRCLDGAVLGTCAPQGDGWIEEPCAEGGDRPQYCDEATAACVPVGEPCPDPGLHRCAAPRLQVCGPHGWRDSGSCVLETRDWGCFHGKYARRVVRWRDGAWAGGVACLPVQGEAWISSVQIAGEDDIWVALASEIQEEGLVTRSTVIVHWDGTWWTEDARLPQFNLGLLLDGSGGLWAYGARHAIFHRRPAGWQDVSPPQIHLVEGLSVEPGGALWAVGSDDDGRAVALRASSSGWEDRKAPRAARGKAVVATGTEQAMAIFGAGLWKWDGTGWHPQAAVVEDRPGCLALAALGPDDVWAASPPWHWDGGSWRRQGVPDAHDSCDLAAGGGGVWSVARAAECPSLGGRAPESWLVRWDGEAWQRDETALGDAIHEANAAYLLTSPALGDVWMAVAECFYP